MALDIMQPYILASRFWSDASMLWQLMNMGGASRGLTAPPSCHHVSRYQGHVPWCHFPCPLCSWLCLDAAPHHKIPGAAHGTGLQTKAAFSIKNCRALVNCFANIVCCQT